MNAKQPEEKLNNIIRAIDRWLLADDNAGELFDFGALVNIRRELNTATGDNFDKLYFEYLALYTPLAQAIYAGLDVDNWLSEQDLIDEVFTLALGTMVRRDAEDVIAA